MRITEVFAGGDEPVVTKEELTVRPYMKERKENDCNLKIAIQNKCQISNRNLIHEQRYLAFEAPTSVRVWLWISPPDNNE